LLLVDGATQRSEHVEATCTTSTTLRRGSRGAAVRCVQAALNDAGYAAGPVDGAFGPMTLRATLAFQRASGLVADGIVGRQTATALGLWRRGAWATSSCVPPAGIPLSARQVVVVTSSGSGADVDLLVDSGAGWQCARTDMPGRVGRNGVRPLAERRSGDGTTPGGVFGLGSMTAPDGQTFQFFGNAANPGVPGGWRQVRAGDCWGATPGTAAYNQLVTRAAAACTSPDEYLPTIGAYSQAALIDANMGPNRSGDQPGEPPLAAAIFLHRHSYDGAGNTRPTSGCVSLSADDLAFVLRRLVPGQTAFVIT
jgi:L,D-peptidoglycan transpeptidase YkuD (ErfK/YbiS/YcfS/YnhG family)